MSEKEIEAEAKRHSIRNRLLNKWESLKDNYQIYLTEEEKHPLNLLKK